MTNNNRRQVSSFIPVIENALEELAETIPELHQGMNREEDMISALMTIILSAKNIANENDIQLPLNI